MPLLADNFGKVKVMNYFWFFTSITIFLVPFSSNYYFILLMVILATAFSNGVTSLHFGV